MRIQEIELEKAMRKDEKRRNIAKLRPFLEEPESSGLRWIWAYAK